MEDLSDFFILVKEEKKKKEEEFNSLLGESADKLVQDIFFTIQKEVKKDKLVEQEIRKEKKPKEEGLRNPEVDAKTIKNHPDISEGNLIERSLGILSEPSNIKQKNDPLTPLNQNFVTSEDLQKHYKIFIERIQQQLSTLGGGGETNLAYMDMPITYVTSSSYTVTPQDYYIGINYAGRVNITLPTPRKNGKVYIVKDELGEASKGTNRHIYIYPSGTDLIDEEDYAILAYDFGSLTFVYRNGWRVV